MDRTEKLGIRGPEYDCIFLVLREELLKLGIIGNEFVFREEAKPVVIVVMLDLVSGATCSLDSPVKLDGTESHDNYW